tara:strand:- start:3470 stop:4426 length:957 start_codon:yes stop_codon:yes gene_type:complete
MKNIKLNQKMNCFICRKGNPKDYGNNNHFDRRKSLEGSWDIYKCDNCGIRSIHPKPSLKELSKYYQIYYKDSNLEIKSGFGSKNDYLRKIYHFFNGEVDPRNFIRKDPNKVMLDFGYGGGTFLKYFHDSGCNIYGAEANDVAVEAGIKAGLKVKKIESFEEIPYENQKFDIVYLMQVFEHLSNPRIFLPELNRVLKNDGELYLALPNAKSIWKNIFKKNWVVWFPPFHIAHYDANILRNLSEEFGFKYETHWSKTPENWLRFSLKALIYKNNNNLEETSTFLDSKLSRVCTMIISMFFNIFAKENDCIMIKLKKVNDV